MKPEGHAQAFWEIRLLVLRESGKPVSRLSSVNELASCPHGCWGRLAAMDSEARGERQGRESVREKELELGDQKGPFSVKPGAGLFLFLAAQSALTGLLSLGTSPMSQGTITTQQGPVWASELRGFSSHLKFSLVP